jgi:hypothetical protein
MAKMSRTAVIGTDPYLPLRPRPAMARTLFGRQD